MKKIGAIRLLLSIGLFAVTLEVCARLDDLVSYGASPFGRYSQESMYTQDALGKRGKPNASFRKWVLNSLGFRGPELNPNRIHIVCLGASETFGLYESEGNEYPRQLEQRLNSQAERFQVINAAIPGESIRAAEKRIPEILKEVRPAVAVVYATPANYINPPIQHLVNGPQLSNSGPIFEWRISDRFQTVLKSVLPESIQDRLRSWSIARSVNGRRTMEVLPQENVDRFRSDLHDLVLMLRKNGVEPVLVTHASAFGNNLTARDRRLLTMWRKFYPLLEEEGFINMERRMNDATRALAREEHVPLVEADHLVPPGPIYFADMVHFTDAGAKLMSELIAQTLNPILEQKAPATLRGSLVRTTEVVPSN